MRQLENTPLDPEVSAALDAIDATLAGDPVDPRHAELAELALLLSAERPSPDIAFTVRLDERVQRRFAPAPQPDGVVRRRGVGRWWLWTPAAGLGAAVLIAIVIVLGGGSRVVRNGSASNSVTSAAPSAGAVASPPSTSKAAPREPQTAAPQASASARNARGAASGPASATAAVGDNVVATPPSAGRKIIQAAQLSLSTNPRRIEDVAQEIFVVVGQVHGIVNNSTITASGGPGGYAAFQLSIPSGSMPQAMTSLSSLRFARVLSRTDTTQDVNNQYQDDLSSLASDRAIRASLLRQLANATTQGEIDSLTIRIHDINARIRGDQARLHALTQQIDYSQVTVTINGGIDVPGPVPVHAGGSGGFTLHQAVHDAGRVLTVAVGVALIGLAALAPIAVLGVLAWWIAVAVRRRRREQALDLV